MRDARLHPRDEVVRADLDDLVHPAQIQADAAVYGDGVRLQAAPLPERHDGDAAPVGEAQDRRHLVAALRADHRVGLAGGVVGEDAPSVAAQLVGVGDDPAVREDAR